MPGTVTVTDPNTGVATDVPAENLPEYQRQGFTVEGDEDRAQRIADQQAKADTGLGETIVHEGISGATAGISDAVGRTLGGEDFALQRRREQQFHPTAGHIANAVGMIAPLLLSGGASEAADIGEGALAAAGEASPIRGALSAVADASPVGLASKAGGAVTDALGGGTLARIAGAGTEGALFGAGQGVSESALSQDPLTAEQIIGNLSTNALLGGTIGAGIASVGRLAELGLGKAASAVREAQAAREAMTAVPDDLAQLDDTGLREELTRAKVAHRADIEAERGSLEDLRDEQRQELSNQILAGHEDMRASQINLATKGTDVQEIAGIPNAYRAFADSNAQLSRLAKDPIGLADNPSMALRALRVRQGALEAVQEKLPQLRAALADDARGAGLDSVDSALAQTKAQISAIEQVDSKLNPVASHRLGLLQAQLEEGTSPRMMQIQGARDALTKGKELGMVGSRVKSIAQTGAGALAHMLPGGGLAAHWMGEQAGELVDLAARRLNGAATKTADATAGHIASLLDVGTKAGRATKGALVAHATEVLSKARFAPEEQHVEPRGDKLGDLFAARSEELRSQTQVAPDGSVEVRPEARQKIAASFDGIRGTAPVLADKLEDVASRRVAYLSSILPRRPDTGDAITFGPDKWKPSDLEIRAFARAVRAVEDPESVEKRLAAGVMTPEEAQAYRAVYPERFADVQQRVLEAAPTLSKTLPMQKKIALSVFTGVNLVPALQPNVLAVLQSTFRNEPGTNGGTEAPAPLPKFSAYGSLKSQDKPTPAQARQDE